MIPDDWQMCTIDDCCDILDNLRVPLNQAQRTERKGNIPYWGANGVLDYIDDYLFDEPLILMAEDGGYFEDVKNRPICHLTSGKCWVNNHAHVLRTKSCVLREWVYYWFVHRDITHYINGSTRSKLNQGDLKKLPIAIPSFSEQKRITLVLSSVDNAIQTTQNVITQTQKVKNGLLQQHLTKGIDQKKFKKTAIGEVPESWNIYKIEELFDQVRNPVYVENKTHYQEIGIRSHGKGIFHKSKITGSEIGSKRVFWVEPNCLILNIVFAWERAVAATSDREKGMIASHRFPMYKPNDRIILPFIVLYFHSLKGMQALGSISPGGAGRNKTLGQKSFLKLSVPVPPLDEQTKIVEINERIERYLDLEEQKLESLKRIKRGLLHDLLTGKIRVRDST